jgi:hypothetical protein
MCGTPFPSGSGTAFTPSYRLAFSELAMLSPLLVRRCSTSPARYFVESDRRRLSLLRIKARLNFPAAWKSPSGEGWRSAARQRADACSTRCPIVHARTVTLRSKRANAGCSPIVAAADRYSSARGSGLKIPACHRSFGATLGTTPGGNTGSSWGAGRPDFTGLS